MITKSQKSITFTLLIMLSLFLVSCATMSAVSNVVIIQATSTPDYQPFLPMLAQVVHVGPVYVTGDTSVPLLALQDAGNMLAIMLEHRPDIGAELRAHGAFTVVASRSETICGLSYFTQYSKLTCQAYGQGGAGGILVRPITACDEKNLLGESDDPYLRYDRSSGSLSQNICVHELAHTIMDVGLSRLDQDRIVARYRAAEHVGLWRGDYAMTNALEFWAVMSQFYFYAGPEQTYDPSFHHVANGPDALKQYDPATFALLNSIYQGSANLR